MLVSDLILHFEGVKSWLFPLWVIDIFKSACFVAKKYNFVRSNIGDELGKNCVGDTEDRLVGMLKKVVISSWKTVQVRHVCSAIKSLGYILRCSYAKGC